MAKFKFTYIFCNEAKYEEIIEIDDAAIADLDEENLASILDERWDKYVQQLLDGGWEKVEE